MPCDEKRIQLVGTFIIHSFVDGFLYRLRVLFADGGEFGDMAKIRFGARCERLKLRTGMVFQSWCNYFSIEWILSTLGEANSIIMP